MQKRDNEDSLNAELKNGIKYAAALIEHCQTMGAAACELPMLNGTEQWIVRAMPKSAEISEARRLLESNGYRITKPTIYQD